MSFYGSSLQHSPRSLARSYAYAYSEDGFGPVGARRTATQRLVPPCAQPALHLVHPTRDLRPTINDRRSLPHTAHRISTVPRRTHTHTPSRIPVSPSTNLAYFRFLCLVSLSPCCFMPCCFVAPPPEFGIFEYLSSCLLCTIDGGRWLASALSRSRLRVSNALYDAFHDYDLHLTTITIHDSRFTIYA